MTKKITVMLPCFNEVDNVIPMHDAVVEQFQNYLPGYEYEILYADNHSTDGTRDKLRILCAADKNTKAILNSRNFGQWNSPYHAMCVADCDALVSMCCDFQEPPELIPRLVHEWEKGHPVVCAIKTESEENSFIRFLRTRYYHLLKRTSRYEQIEHFTGTGLYDRSFLEVLKKLDDPSPYLRGIVGELGPANRKDIPYKQLLRKTGKSKNNFSTLYDAAMIGFTSSTKAPLRICTFVGAIAVLVCLVVGILYLILKYAGVINYPAGTIAILFFVLLLGSLQLLFLGFMGEYILAMNSRTLHRPLVIEEERLGEWPLA
ncbi:MAG: glycosyltransferase family 2 protein [Atopobiaceae bacterium]|jgi:glycosyltransferase involved in cell wall biosynthesis|nr:glycosyltransferase family 2 protein [Atopobiaceae bacterium]